MKLKRQYGKKTKTAFLILGGISAIIIGGMIVFAQQTASSASEGIKLYPGSVVYDSTYTPVELVTEGTVRKNSDGQFFLDSGSGELPLGAHTMAYTGNGIQVFGGGYRINEKGQIDSLKDGQEYEDINEPVLYKIADRRYIMTGNRIEDSSGIFQVSEYSYIVMDTVGNARLYSGDTSLKTTQPTVITSGNISFDIAGEQASAGNQVVDMSRVFGTTNTFDSGIYKTIEEEQVPDDINLVVRGGNGGDGGSGGSGGTGGTGGTGGIGGRGGTGGNGGTGGMGGSGGRGGTGGTGGIGGIGGQGGKGGAGGVGEDKNAVSSAKIRAAYPHKSSITIDYSFTDPYGSLGTVYLEAHCKQLLDKYGITSIIDLYENPEKTEGSDKGPKYYWEAYEKSENLKRSTVVQYDNEHVFTGLKENTLYYVVMGHSYYETDNSGEKTLYRVIDDYISVRTCDVIDTIDISAIGIGAKSLGYTVTVDMELESIDSAGKMTERETDSGKQKYPVIVVGPEAGDETDENAIRYALTWDDILDAAAGRFTFKAEFTDIEQFHNIETLKAEFIIWDGLEVRTLLTTKTKNTFYADSSDGGLLTMQNLYALFLHDLENGLLGNEDGVPIDGPVINNLGKSKKKAAITDTLPADTEETKKPEEASVDTEETKKPEEASVNTEETKKPEEVTAGIQETSKQESDTVTSEKKPITEKTQ